MFATACKRFPAVPLENPNANVYNLHTDAKEYITLHVRQGTQTSAKSLDLFGFLLYIIEDRGGWEILGLRSVGRILQ